MNYQAISILNPAVENIINGSKTIEIRSWKPDTIPLKNVVLVQNEKYLVNQNDFDLGTALAVVDFVSVREWSYDEFLMQNTNTTLNKKWAPGYFIWEIDNIRPLNKAVECVARKGIYLIDLDIVF